MGSVTVIFVPFLVVALFIVQFFISITGKDVSDVVLPYAPDKGLVWKYDNENDPYISLKETKIVGDEQIFRFKTREYSDDEDYIYGCGYMMDLVFTDENGNTETYYATARNVSLDMIKIWAEDEVSVYKYTATAHKVYDDSKWSMNFSLGDSSEYVVYDPDITCNPKTFTVVYEKGMEDDDIIWLYFKNSSAEKDYSESHKIRLDCSGRDVKLLNESFWSSDNP